ncbi:MAG: glycosyltransferase family 2 protein [Hyphomonadaceae bacterium]|nr:glycosyltransferase family 2 protein [Hyphomonadaceae bacterium]
MPDILGTLAGETGLSAQMSATAIPLKHPEQKPAITVIMVSYMTGPALMEALRSVVDDPDIAEVILVDNGNPELTQQRLREIALENDRVRLLQGHGNIGFSKACNYGVSVSTGEYLLFLNPDAVIRVGSAMKMVECGQELTRPWVVGALIKDEFGQEQRGARRKRLTPSRAFITFLGLHRLPFFNSLHLENTAVPTRASPVEVVSGACSMFDRESFDMLDGFDEAYFLHVEDIDICERVHRTGGEVYFQPESTVMHYGSTSNVTRQMIEWKKLCGFVHYFLKFSNDRFEKTLTTLAIPFMAAAVMGRACWLAIRAMIAGR